MYKSEGDGWRIALDIRKKNFPILIGTDCFSVELTIKEFNSIKSVLDILKEQFDFLKLQLMDEEEFNLEYEKGSFYGELFGRRHAWNLRFIVHDLTEGSRSFEIMWDCKASDKMSIEIKKVWDSIQ